MMPTGTIWRSVCVALTLSAAAYAENGGELYRGPYLQQATPESIVVVWRTEGASEPVLRYGVAPGALDNTVQGDAVTRRVAANVDAPEDVPLLYEEPEGENLEEEYGHDPSTRDDTYQFEAHVTGLEPDTRYYYAVYDGNRKLAGGGDDHYFDTSPPHGADTHLRAWVVGDSGTGGGWQKDVRDAMHAFTDETGRPLDTYIHVGDMAYGDGTDYEFQRKFFEIYQDTLRNTVCWPTMGNHEGHTSRGLQGFGPYYDAYVVPTNGEAGGVPSGSEAYYSFRIADAHFICLDSHDLDRTPTGAMAQWLRADLEKADAEWLIAFWHHPPYTKGSHDSDREGQLIEMRTHIMPILEAGGVDLVLTGHSHIYERSMLMDGAYETPTVAEGVILDDGDGNPDGDGAYRKSAGLNPHEGAVQIVAGHGGTGLSRSGTMPVMREIILDHGSVILDFDGDTLTGTMVDKDNDRRDLFQIVKEGEVKVSRVEDPWQPDPNSDDITEFQLDFLYDSDGDKPQGWAVAHGAKDGLVITGRGDSPRHNRMAAKAGGDAPLIGVFDRLSDHEFEYETQFRVTEAGPQTGGLVFGYVDSNNYYRVTADAKNDVVRVIHVQDGEEEILDEHEVDIKPERWLDLALGARIGMLQVEFGPDLEYRVSGVEPEDGKLGLYIPAGGEGLFDRFEIERFRSRR